MELSYLQEYVVFSRYLSMAETARQMHISQPALSHHIAALEREFGVPLVNHELPLSLTRAGKLLVTRANEIDSLVGKTLEEVRAAGQTEYELKVALPQTTGLAGRYFLERLFSDFAKAYPQVHLRTVRLTAESVAKAFADDTIDCAGVVVCPLLSDMEQGIRFRRVVGFPVVQLALWVDKTNPLATLDEIRWSDLHDLKMPMASNYSLACHRAAEQLMAEHGIKTTSRVSGESLSDFMNSYQPDEVSLFDMSSADTMWCKISRERVCKPICEPDAISDGYVALRPDRDTEALALLNEYLDSLAREYADA